MKKTFLVVLWVGFGAGLAFGQNQDSLKRIQDEETLKNPVMVPPPVVSPPTNKTEQITSKGDPVTTTGVKNTQKSIKNEAIYPAKTQKEENKSTVEAAAAKKSAEDSIAGIQTNGATSTKLQSILENKPINMENLANEIRKTTSPESPHLNAAKELADAWRIEKDHATNSNRHFWIAIVLGFLTVFGLIIGWVISQNALKKKHGGTISRLTKSMESNMTTGHLRDSTSGLESEIIDLKRQLGQAKKMIEEFKKPNPTTSDETNPGSKIIISSGDAAPVKINRYFNSPNPTDKSFNDLNGSTSIQPFASTYEITLDGLDSETASFRLLASQETLRKIMNTPETYIEPMCQAENAFNPMAKSIITIEHGVVKKRDGIWHLETKARIRYE